jgi:hypothetical protein
MNSVYINNIKHKLSPSDDAKNRIESKIRQQYRTKNRPIGSKAIIAAAVIVMLIMTTTFALAYSGVLQEIFLGH